MLTLVANNDTQELVVGPAGGGDERDCSWSALTPEDMPWGVAPRPMLHGVSVTTSWHDSTTLNARADAAGRPTMMPVLFFARCTRFYFDVRNTEVNGEDAAQVDAWDRYGNRGANVVIDVWPEDENVGGHLRRHRRLLANLAHAHLQVLLSEPDIVGVCTSSEWNGHQSEAARLRKRALMADAGSRGVLYGTQCAGDVGVGCWGAI